MDIINKMLEISRPTVSIQSFIVLSFSLLRTQSLMTVWFYKFYKVNATGRDLVEEVLPVDI